jgi:sarcosine oxidase subunit alpha
MAPTVKVRINGTELDVDAEGTLAAALLNAGIVEFRESVSGEARAPLCGMGICFECRVTVNGVPHRRACLETITEGMEIQTGV